MHRLFIIIIIILVQDFELWNILDVSEQKYEHERIAFVARALGLGYAARGLCAPPSPVVQPGSPAEGTFTCLPKGLQNLCHMQGATVSCKPPRPI